MKKYVCLLLAALLLMAAGCAGAEEVVKPVDLGEEGVIVYNTGTNPFRYRYVYQITLTYIDGDGQPITDQPVDFLISNSPTEREAPLPIMTGGDVAQLNVLTTNSNGEIKLQFPVLNNDGSDFLKGFSNTSVYIWSKYKNQTDNEWQMQRELIRLPSPPTVASMEALFSQDPSVSVVNEQATQQFSTDAPEWVHHLLVSVKNSDGMPYSGVLTVKVSGELVTSSLYCSNGQADITIPDALFQPGSRVELFDGNGNYIDTIEIPDNSPKEPVTESVVVEQTELPTVVPVATPAQEKVLNEIDEVDSSAVQKGGLLKGWSETLVGILAVVCLVIYLVCWLVLKFPEKFGLDNQGKGV